MWIVSLEAAVRLEAELTGNLACRWLAERARYWTPGTKEEGAEAYEIARRGRLRFRKGYCYSNAMRLAQEGFSAGLTYVEGVVLDPSGPWAQNPLWHGWVVNGEGRVVDPTHYPRADVPPDVRYWGVALPPADIAEAYGRWRGTAISSLAGEEHPNALGMLRPVLTPELVERYDAKPYGQAAGEE